jgi:hypothetical protein
VLTLNLSNVKSFVSDEELASYLPRLQAADRMLRDGSGKGSDFLGWLNLPESYDRAAFTDKTNLLMNHFIDMAVQGYGWTAA